MFQLGVFMKNSICLLGSFVPFVLPITCIVTICSEKELKKPQLSYGIIFAPVSVGRAMLPKYRSDMSQYLLKNEQAAQEDVKKFWGLRSETWQKARQKMDEDKEAKRRIMQDPSNDSNAKHNPLITSHPIYQNIQDECARHEFNPNNLVIGTEFDEGSFAWTRINPLQSNPAAPVEMHYSQRALDAPPSLRRCVVGHETMHLAQLHAVEKNAAKYILTTLVDESQYLQDKQQEVFADFANEEHKSIWQQDYRPILVKIDANSQQMARWMEEQSTVLSRLPEYENSEARANLIAAQEKTADTLLACTDSKVAKNNAVVFVTTMKSMEIGYPENRDDVVAVGASWAMTDMIEKRAVVQQSFEKNRRLIKDTTGNCTLL
jgi:hypothetical protein